MDARARHTAGNLALLAGAILGSVALLEGGLRLYLRFNAPSALLSAADTDAGRRERWYLYQRFQRAHGGHDLASFEASQHDPLLGWVPRANLVDYVHPSLAGNRLPVGTNAAGMRGRREFAADKPAGVRRIVLIGDSFTFGIGEDDDHVWPARLAADLAGWEVLNLGVYGYGTDQQLLMLRERGMRWQPDVVIQAFYVDDHFRNGMAFRDYAKPRFVLDGDRLRLTGVPVPTPDELLALEDAAPRLHSRLFDLVRQRLGGAASTPRDADLVALTRAILRETVRTSREGGARFLLVVIPMQHAPERSRPIEDLLETWATELEVPILNVREPLAERERTTGIRMWHVHFTRAGHEKTARLVRRKLADLGWAP